MKFYALAESLSPLSISRQCKSRPLGRCPRVWAEPIRRRCFSTIAALAIRSVKADLAMLWQSAKIVVLKTDSPFHADLPILHRAIKSDGRIQHLVHNWIPQGRFIQGDPQSRPGWHREIACLQFQWFF